MCFNSNCLISYLLYGSFFKIPVGKCHYVTNWGIGNFYNLNCIEQSLTGLTCKCKNMTNCNCNCK